MKPAEIKRYDKYEASLNTNLADRYVLAADHDRVVADYKRAMDNLINTLHVEQDRNQAARRDRKAAEVHLEEAEAKAAALTEIVEKYQACRVHDVDEKNWLRDQNAALTERLRVARDLLLKVSDELHTCDGILNATTWVNIDAWLQREEST